MEILEDWGDVVPHFSVSEETGCCILDQLESVDGGGGDAGEEGIAIIKAGGDEGMDESFCSVG